MRVALTDLAFAFSNSEKQFVPAGIEWPRTEPSMGSLQLFICHALEMIYAPLNHPGLAEIPAPNRSQEVRSKLCDSLGTSRGLSGNTKGIPNFWHHILGPIGCKNFCKPRVDLSLIRPNNNEGPFPQWFWHTKKCLLLNKLDIKSTEFSTLTAFESNGLNK